MADLARTVADNRTGIDVFIDHARSLDSDRWFAAVRPNGWSPAQIADHLVRVYDFGTGAVEGTVRTMRLPRPVRWLLRTFYLDPVLQRKKFSGKTKAPGIFSPAPESGDALELLARLRTASERFAATVERAIGSGRSTVEHPMFGTVGLVDFLELQVIHVRHHRSQLPPIIT